MTGILVVKSVSSHHEATSVDARNLAVRVSIEGPQADFEVIAFPRPYLLSLSGTDRRFRQCTSFMNFAPGRAICRNRSGLVPSYHLSMSAT